MKRLLACSYASALSLLSAVAHADQCAALEEGDGAKIFALLENSGAVSGTVFSYCEPCGDTHATEVRFRAKDLSFEREADGAYFTLRNKGRIVDAAYVYAPTRGGGSTRGVKQAVRLSSLAKLSCEEKGLVGPATISIAAQGNVLVPPPVGSPR